MSGLPANSARMVVRLADTVDLTEYAKVLSDSLAPVKTDGYDVAVSQSAGFTSNNLNVVVSGENATDVASANDAVLAALASNPDLLNLKSDLSKGTPEIQVTPDPNKAIMVGLTAAQVAQEVRAALVGSVATRIVLDENGAATDVFVQMDPAAVGSVDDLASPARRDGRQAAARPGGNRGTGRRAGLHHPHRPGARCLDLGRDRVHQHGQGQHGRPGRDRRPGGRGPDPRGRGRAARRRHGADGRSVRRPVRLHGRGRSWSSTWRWC